MEHELTVLLVDDEEAILTIARQAFQRFGLSLLTADDGTTGVELFRQKCEEIDVVILDMEMPNMSGEEAFVIMQEIDHDVPIIIASGSIEEDAIEKLGGVIPDGFIQKPYRISSLLQKIREVT